MTAITCALCGEPVDPSGPSTFTRVQAWERKGLNSSRRGGSDIVMRERLNDYAHGWCVERAKAGVSAGQEALSL